MTSAESESKPGKVIANIAKMQEEARESWITGDYLFAWEKYNHADTKLKQRVGLAALSFLNERRKLLLNYGKSMLKGSSGKNAQVNLAKLNWTMKAQFAHFQKMKDEKQKANSMYFCTGVFDLLGTVPVLSLEKIKDLMQKDKELHYNECFTLTSRDALKRLPRLEEFLDPIMELTKKLGSFELTDKEVKSLKKDLIIIPVKTPKPIKVNYRPGMFSDQFIVWKVPHEEEEKMETETPEDTTPKQRLVYYQKNCGVLFNQIDQFDVRSSFDEEELPKGGKELKKLCKADGVVDAKALDDMVIEDTKVLDAAVKKLRSLAQFKAQESSAKMQKTERGAQRSTRL